MGGLLEQPIHRESKRGLKVRCNSRPEWLARTKGDEGFQRVPDLETLRLLLTKLARFYPDRKLTFNVEIAKLSWSEPEGRGPNRRIPFAT